MLIEWNVLMFEELFEGKLERSDIKDIWSEYCIQEQKILNYKGTNIKQANILLNSIMSEEERNCLENAFFGHDGWYKRINGLGMNQIKLAAMSLGIVNNVFTFDRDVEKDIIKSIQGISEEQQILMMRCYLKQKMVTYVTLDNYLRNVRKDKSKTIVLYRGLNNKPNSNGKYFFASMEAWSSSYDMAYRFARSGGYVITKEYPISKVFAGMRSTFKNKENNIYRNNGYFVRREREMIVENSEECYDYGSTNNFFLPFDKDVY